MQIQSMIYEILPLQIHMHTFVYLLARKKSRRRKEEVQTARKFNVTSQGHLAHININIRSPHCISF